MTRTRISLSVMMLLLRAASRECSEDACLLACELYCRYVLPLLLALYAVLAVVNVMGFCCAFLLCWGCPSSALLRTGGGSQAADRLWASGE